jgi:hypothetical protein
MDNLLIQLKPCYKCLGKKVNKSGKKCKKCDGSGENSDKLIHELKTMIQEEYRILKEKTLK